MADTGVEEKPAEFDVYAGSYDAALNQGLAVSGQSKEYFARRRVEFLSQILQRMQFQSKRVLDFGCGTGAATPFLLNNLSPRPESLFGVDVSPELVSLARRDFGSEQANFLVLEDLECTGQFDLAFCNGVFHHIRPEERAQAVGYVKSALRPGGLFAFWENNPWNPGTRYVMSKIPFDRDAITLTAPQARRLLISAGLEVLSTDFLFIFPGPLSWLCGVETLLSRWPLGAQYQVLCRKPEA